MAQWISDLDESLLNLEHFHEIVFDDSSQVIRINAYLDDGRFHLIKQFDDRASAEDYWKKLKKELKINL